MDFKYRRILKNVDENLVARDFILLKFLCQDFIADGKLEKARKPRDVFQELEQKGFLGPGEKLLFLAELLQRIHRVDLIKKLELGSVKDVQARLAVNRPGPKFSRFRLLLLDICDTLTSEDLDSMKYECQSLISKGQQEKITHPAMLLSTLQQNDNISEYDVSFLEEVMASVGSKEIVQKVREYRASIVRSDDASSSGASLVAMEGAPQIPGIPGNVPIPEGHWPVQQPEYQRQQETPVLMSPEHFQVPPERRPEQPYAEAACAEPMEIHPADAKPQWQQAKVQSAQTPQGEIDEPMTEAMEVQNPATTVQEQQVTNVELPRYRMDTSPLGICVIINNEDFSQDTTIRGSKKLGYRAGSSKDTGKLYKLFKKLGFDVKVKVNLPASKMLRCLEEVGNLDHHQYSCFVCCILTHGAKDKVYGSDGVSVDISDLTSCVKSTRCRSLAGKPKLFFMQACQGTEHQVGVMATDSESEADYSIPNEADFLLAYATVPGFVSYRSPSQGSWFITILEKCIKKYHAQCDLLSIMVIVNDEVSRGVAEIDGKAGAYKQVPAPLVTLRKNVYFPATEFEAQ